MTEIVTKPFSLTSQDYNGLFLTANVRAFFEFPLGLMYFINIFFLPYIFAGQHITSRTWPVYVGGMVVMAVFFVIIAPLFTILSAHRVLKKAGNALAERTVRLTPDYIDFNGAEFSNRMVWKTFRYAVGNRKAIYLVTRSRSGYVVLNSAFDSAEQRLRFLCDAKRYIAAAKTRPAATLVKEDVAREPKDFASKPYRMTALQFAILLTHNLYQMFLKPGTALVIIAAFTAMDFWIGYQADFRLFDLTTLLWLGPVEYAGMFLLAIPLLSPFAWLYFRGQPEFKGDRRVFINEHGVTVITQSTRVTIGWAEIRKISRRFGVILISPEPRGAWLVPPPAFADRKSAMAFYEQAQVWWRMARKTG